MFRKPLWDYLSFIIWHVIFLEADIRRWRYYGHKGMVSSNTWVGCGDQMVSSSYWRTPRMPRRHPHTITSLAWTFDTSHDAFMLFDPTTGQHFSNLVTLCKLYVYNIINLVSGINWLEWSAAIAHLLKGPTCFAFSDALIILNQSILHSFLDSLKQHIWIHL